MNCEELEQDIYLYRELSTEEQAAVDRHVATCAGCRALLEDVQQQYVLAHQAAGQRPQAQDPARLTAAIMTSIGTTQRKQVFMDSAWLRYAMAAASVLLAVAFFVEQSRPPGRRETQVAATPPPLHSPVMDTRALLARQGQNRVKPQKSLFTLYANCIQHNDCDNAAVRNFKTKMKL